MIPTLSPAVPGARIGGRWISLTGRIALASAVFFALLWAAASFWFPFGMDQGIFASEGDTILRGGMPYRDAWDMKGPFPYYVFALAQWLFGRHLWSIRILDLPLVVAGAAGLYVIAARFSSRLEASWAALAFPLWIASLGWRNTIQPDTWATILLIFAALPLVSERATLRGLLTSAFLIGCATLTKPLYPGFIALPLLSIVFQPSRDGERKWVRTIPVMGIAVVPVLLMAAWFAYRGALGDLIDVHILYTVRTYSTGRTHQLLPLLVGVLKFFLRGPVLWALPVVAAGLWTIARKAPRFALLIGVWLAFSVACVAAQGKFYDYHWVIVFPPFLILAAAGLHGVLRTISEQRAIAWRASGALAAVCACVSVAELLPVPASEARLWLKFITGRISTAEYYSTFGPNARPAMTAAAYIAERTTPTDHIAVYGNEAVILFLSGRPSSTRFVFGLPLTEGGPKSPRDEYRREFVGALQRTPPAYFVVGKPWGATSKENAVHGFPGLEDFLNQDYFLATHIGRLDLYRHKT